jgi:hypothetical protein
VSRLPETINAEWNNPLNKVEPFYAGKLVERRDGVVMRDLTTAD